MSVCSLLVYVVVFYINPLLSPAHTCIDKQRPPNTGGRKKWFTK
jgi:hypothetical protein